uniref:Uncharacterized protein n=1 Tax=Arundo donax TaxID=35708 RepID=A0A0A9C135_ARUDO
MAHFWFTNIFHQTTMALINLSGIQIRPKTLYTILRMQACTGI